MLDTTITKAVNITRFSLTDTDGSKYPEEALSNKKRVIESVRGINSAVLPISYTESFYNSLFRYPEDQSVAWIASVRTKEGEKEEEEPVGALILKPDKGAGVASILTFAVLSRHRSRGIGKLLIEQATEECRRRLGDSNDKSIWKEVEVHVQEDNEGAVRFYKSHGFHKKKGKGEEKNYYRRALFGSTTATVLYKNILSDKEKDEPAKKKRKVDKSDN